ncbi:MAG: type IV pilin protein [Pseudomonadota bacterium]
MQNMHGRTAGFTLLELLIVITIVGLLATVALPGYQQSVLIGGRSEGRALLLQVAANQERYYSDHHTYSGNADPLVSPAVVVLNSESGLYRVSVASCPDGGIQHCFIATATPTGRQLADTCQTLTVTQTGRKGATGGTAEECWR